LPASRHRRRERGIAGSDCGFSVTFAGLGKLDPDISFKKKPATMAEGAAIASKTLWGRPRSWN